MSNSISTEKTHSSAIPYISAIERLSTEDGPGLRDVVFFMGCTHQCFWCHNPETISPEVSILFFEYRCIRCGRCSTVCSHHAIDADSDSRIDRTLCKKCGECAKICTSNAIEKVGQQYTVDELVDILLKDKLYFENSHGGITFSGGEPTLHMEYLGQVCQRLNSENISVAIETAGSFQFESFKTQVLPYVEIVYFDIKLLDPVLHKKRTGISNELILRNFTQLIRCENIIVIPRTPLIPGITDTPENLAAIFNFLRDLRVSTWEKLAFNKDYAAKWHRLGKTPKKI